MKRRNFLQSILAIPAVAAIMKSDQPAPAGKPVRTPYPGDDLPKVKQGLAGVYVVLCRDQATSVRIAETVAKKIGAIYDRQVDETIRRHFDYIHAESNSTGRYWLFREVVWHANNRGIANIITRAKLHTSERFMAAGIIEEQDGVIQVAKDRTGLLGRCGDVFEV